MLPAESFLDPAVDHRVVLDAVQEDWRRVKIGSFRLCLGLRRLFRDQVHRGTSFSRFVDYAEFKFGIPAKLAGLFSFLGEHLERLPETRKAMETGELSYTKVREFATVATPENEQEWIDLALTSTNRRLEKAVAKERARREGREFEDKVVFRSELTGREMQAVRKSRVKLMKLRNRPVRNEEVFPLLAMMFAEGTLTTDGKPRKKAAPYLSLQFCPKCLDCWTPVPGENMKVKLEEWLDELKRGTPVVSFLDRLLCDCEEVKHRRDLCDRVKEPTGAPAVNRHVPADVLRRIQARDGFRCRVSGCGNPGPLENGHMKPYRDGVPMIEEFLGTQCEAHNRMIETGALRVEGHAPFERYYRRDGTFIGIGYDPKPRPLGGSHADPHAGIGEEDEEPGAEAARPPD